MPRKIISFESTMGYSVKPGCTDAFEVRAIYLLEYRNPRQAYAVAARFGFTGEIKTYGQIGQELGVSSSRARDMVNKGLRRLSSPGYVNKLRSLCFKTPLSSIRSPFEMSQRELDCLVKNRESEKRREATRAARREEKERKLQKKRESVWSDKQNRRLIAKQKMELNRSERLRKKWSKIIGDSYPLAVEAMLNIEVAENEHGKGSSEYLDAFEAAVLAEMKRKGRYRKLL